MDMRVTAPASERFVPTHPARPATPVPVWKLFVGETARNPVASCAAPGFQQLYGSRRIVGVNYHLVSGPEGIRRILLDNQPNYVRPSFLPALLPLLADGLFGADGPAWKSQRRLMAPVFTPAAVAEFMPLFAEAAKDAVADWTPGVIDVARTATGLTFDVISRALFSGEHGLAGDEAADLVATALADAGRPKPTTLLGVAWLDRLSKGAKAQRVMRDRIAAFVARRQGAADPPPDFITRLIEAFEPELGRADAARLVLSNAVTFLVAGHETTANALAWTLYLLSEQPQAQAWAAEEARDALNHGDPQAVLENLTYLRWVLDEALRLYPPAPRIERQAADDDEIGPLAVRKGDLVGIWPWVVHRHQALWDDPDAFDPERFAPEARAAQHRFQYIPFGAGPRICIGAQFATAEALLVLAEWLARYEFAPVPGHRVEVASDIALRPKGGLPLIVSRRV
ncbi:MAG: cytochrome P450 [Phenylobacterium sp.]